jgi:hypothetical protein
MAAGAAVVQRIVRLLVLVAQVVVVLVVLVLELAQQELQTLVAVAVAVAELREMAVLEVPVFLLSLMLDLKEVQVAP